LARCDRIAADEYGDAASRIAQVPFGFSGGTRKLHEKMKYYGKAV
jgi:hypothetical protein